MSEDSGLDKSFEASPEKQRKARKKGNIPLSTDAAVLASYLGFLLGMLGAGGAALGLAKALVPIFWHPEELGQSVLSGSAGGELLFREPLMAVMMVIGPAAIAVVLVLVAQQGIVLAPTKLKPDLRRINPVEGFKKRYGAQGMSEFLKSGLKIIFVAIVGGLYLWLRQDHFLSAFQQEAGMFPELMRREVTNIIGLACIVAAIIAALDLPAKRMAHSRKLKMTRQEVSDEHKEMEGDPQQKQMRRRRAQEFSQATMLRATAKADVVIVNPTHYAVALQWDRQPTSVPVCVAKGVDHLALSLIDRARLSGVPVREDPPCARALHATVKVGDAIREEHFAAVAAAIRFADAIRRPTDQRIADSI
ncbi:flagellar biosynthesis protein FlhB [Parvularcula sp. LCG005]|uniref:EscU/YscU/HrcU family type III secretion system export apparatus switch protein n=1 Tax=Parvularcula sp. LCG005 TaxID=3078805 RepID=UPI002942A120|nr:EscU/YscU/HrcU family type III secretion system export apparatus switch protein [Parvularcula sp. LCG005]WOI52940.1 EscU/YscU/HrcU family type III secretion system export apparatus switch protein [Parvularcula sp. LCG005]